METREWKYYIDLGSPDGKACWTANGYGTKILISQYKYGSYYAS